MARLNSGGVLGALQPLCSLGRAAPVLVSLKPALDCLGLPLVTDANLALPFGLKLLTTPMPVLPREFGGKQSCLRQNIEKNLNSCILLLISLHDSAARQVGFTSI